MARDNMQIMRQTKNTCVESFNRPCFFFTESFNGMLASCHLNTRTFLFGTNYLNFNILTSANRSIAVTLPFIVGFRWNKNQFDSPWIDLVKFFWIQFDVTKRSAANYLKWTNKWRHLSETIQLNSITRLLFIGFHSNKNHSIALKAHHLSSFDSNFMWLKIRPQTPENHFGGGRSRVRIFVNFTAQRFVQSSRTQKPKCRALQAPSNDRQHTPKVAAVYSNYARWKQLTSKHFFNFSNQSTR